MIEVGKIYRYVPNHTMSGEKGGPGWCSSTGDLELANLLVEVTDLYGKYIRAKFTTGKQYTCYFTSSCLKNVGHKNKPERSCTSTKLP